VKHLVLNHLVPADDPQTRPEHWEAEVRMAYAGLLTVARDGVKIVV
jgi:ribonuclease BN (tRNA processing enzyme)